MTYKLRLTLPTGKKLDVVETPLTTQKIAKEAAVNWIRTSLNLKKVSILAFETGAVVAVVYKDGKKIFIDKTREALLTGSKISGAGVLFLPIIIIGSLALIGFYVDMKDRRNND